MQGAADFASGGIAMRVQNTAAAVRSFAGECQLCAIAVKFCSPGNQFLDALRPFLHQNVRSFRVDDAVTGIDGVLKMEADFVFVAQGDSNSALGVLRG